MAINAGDTTYYQAKRGIVQDGLVLNLDAAVDQSYPGNGTTWYDLEGSNSGTLTNGPTFDRDNGGSIVFDGTDDKVLFSEINLQTTFTACIFVKFDPATIPYDTVIIGHSGGQYILFVYNSSQVVTKDGPYAITSSASLSSDTWYSLTITRNGTSVNWFQDGVNIGNGTIGSSDMGFTALGSYSDNSSYVLNGNIASMQLYNRVLTAAEVLQNYNATKGRFE